MAVTAGHARASFDLKSATLPLIAVLLKTADLAELAEALQARLGDTPDFFEHDPVLVDLAPVAESDEAIDFPALILLLRSYRVVPLAVRGGSAAQMEAALAAGLLPAPEASPTRSAAPAPAQEVVREVVHDGNAVHNSLDFLPARDALKPGQGTRKLLDAQPRELGGRDGHGRVADVEFPDHGYVIAGAFQREKAAVCGGFHVQDADVGTV